MGFHRRVFSVCTAGEVKTLMYFDGCAPHLGCTITLRGGPLSELRKVGECGGASCDLAPSLRVPIAAAFRRDFSLFAVAFPVSRFSAESVPLFSIFPRVFFPAKNTLFPERSNTGARLCCDKSATYCRNQQRPGVK